MTHDSDSELRRRQQHALAWLRAQANAEREPKARAALIEAHNAVLSILEGRYDLEARSR